MANNLLVIVSDEHQARAMGCAGHDFIETPHLDRLAASGMRFTNAYTPSPICVPARAAFATGRYVHQTGCWDNAMAYSGAHPSWGHQLQDADITVDIIKDTQINFSQLQGCSFDKGFYSAMNLTEAKKLIDKVVMPKKGKLNQLEKIQESNSEFVKTRHQHSAVESAINCLEQHGLDRCPDNGKEGFDYYVALAVLSRNVQRIGEILQKKRHMGLCVSFI